MILPPKQNPSYMQIFKSIVAVGGSHYIEVTREAVGRGGETTSLPCPIINAPNRNEAGIPALTHQDKPIEIVSLYIPFQLLVPKIERNGFQ